MRSVNIQWRLYCLVHNLEKIGHYGRDEQLKIAKIRLRPEKLRVCPPVIHSEPAPVENKRPAPHILSADPPSSTETAFPTASLAEK